MTHKVLFVCLGNICRSPLAEGIFSGLVDDADLTGDFQIESAGTGAWHIGNPPDPRSVDVAERHGIDISHQQARTVTLEDFDRFDVIVAMDRDNLAKLTAMSDAPRAEIRLLFNAPPMDVPDPYFGGPEGFEDVFQLIRSGCENMLTTLR
ncbi:low molecular weight protein-tyrosine-phosphatase [Roseibium sp. MMSF_3412]|uniref:low molecular weight protein-tyrosine-phosphatase n=1 Tax=Roseibium sp. MMSF_3412 TaxID=3046712 RepID=UPI00273E64B2|nr:low molecular weight protein-tyrosine-phosphatase [Roseibium sp. MMSF_3412]